MANPAREYIVSNTTVNFNTSSSALFNVKPSDEDCIFLDNAKLIIDSDNRWGYNGFLFSQLQDWTYGDLLIDGTKVWEIPFNSSSGYVPQLSSMEHSQTVPASGLTSGAYGELLNVWNNTNFSPLTASSSTSTALPPSGWIKLRSKTGNFIAGETIRFSNGSTIVASTSGKRSWINIAGTAVFNHWRYGQRGASVGLTNIFSNLSAVGDWYYLNETTNGQYNQQIKVPVQDILYGAWIEDSPNSNNYVKFHNACSMWGLTATENSQFLIGTLSSNGFFFSQNHSNLTITLAYSGQDGMYGYLPPAGCKIRIPNIMLSVVKRENDLSYLDNSITEIYGAYNYQHGSSLSYNTYISNCNSNWRSFDVNFGYTEIHNSCFNTGQALEDAKVKLTNCICTPSYKGYIGSIYWQAGGGYRSAFRVAGDVTVLDSSIIGAYTEGNLPNTEGAGIFAGQVSKLYVKDSRFCQPFAFYRPMIDFTTMGSQTTTYLENVTLIGGRLRFVAVQNITCKNLKVSSRLNGLMTFKNTNVERLFSLDTCRNIYIEGVYGINELENVIIGSDGISKCVPYSILHAVNTEIITLKNVGTTTRPLTCVHQSTNRNFDGVLLNYGCSDIKLQNIHLIAKKLFSIDNDSIGYNLGQGTNNCLFENVYVYDSPIKVVSDADTIIQHNSTVRSLYANQSIGQVRFAKPAPVGTHWVNTFTARTSGVLILYTSQSTDVTKPFVTENFQQTPYRSGYNPDGANIGDYLTMSNIGDYVIHETPYYIKGITGFQNASPIAWCSDIFNISFQYDISGNETYNGTWLSLGPQVGEYQQTKGNAQYLSSINIDPNIGIKLKIKIEAPNTTRARTFANLSLFTKTDAISQQILYPPPKDTQGIIRNLTQGTRVQIYNTTTNQELFNGVYASAGDFIYEYTNGVEISTNDVVRIRLVYVNGVTAKKRQELIAGGSADGFSLFVVQEDDNVYNNFAINGSTVTEFTADYTNTQVDINDSDQATNLKRLYAWWVNNEYTANGIRNFFGGIEAEDSVNFKIDTSRVNLKLDNTTNVGVVFEGDYRLYRTDGQIPIVTTTSGGGSIVLYAGRVSTNTILVPSPALTQQESATLNKINTLPQDTFNLNLSSITNNNSIGARLKNTATVSNVSQIVTDALLI